MRTGLSVVLRVRALEQLRVCERVRMRVRVCQFASCFFEGSVCRSVPFGLFVQVPSFMLPFINESPIPVLYAPFKTCDVRAASEADQSDA